MPDARPLVPPVTDDTLSVAGDPNSTATRPVEPDAPDGPRSRSNADATSGSAFARAVAAIEGLLAPDGPATVDRDEPLDSAWTAPSAPAAPADLPVIPGYDIESELARGGMGRVLAGRELALDREVAIKVLLPGAPAARFVTESKITAKLPHPNIPPVYALGTLNDGSPFLAMKFVRGQTLADQLKARTDTRGELPRFVQVFEKIAQAVGYAHSRGVIHRDLKPANVMVGEFGEVQVMDWGLARDMRGAELGTWNEGELAATRRTAGQTQAGAILGTPAYMAPEQARGEPADARSDVFSLGGILCAILTGQAVFVGGRVVDAIRKAADGDTADARDRLDGCGADPDLVALAKRCLAADPAARFADAGELAEAVVGWRTAGEERARKAEVGWQRAAVYAREKARRGALRRAFAAGVILLVAALVAAYLIDDARRRASASEAELRTAQEEARLKDDVRRARGALPGVTRRTAYWFADQYRLAEAEAILQGTEFQSEAEVTAEVKEQFAAVRRDLAFIRRATEIPTTFLLPAEGPATKLAARYADFYRTEYAKLFASHGFDLLAADPKGAADQLLASPIRLHLARALDHWMFAEPDPDTRRTLRGIALVLQGQPWNPRPKADWSGAPDLRQLWTDTRIDYRTPALYSFVLTGLHRCGADSGDIRAEAEAQFPSDIAIPFQRGVGDFLTALRYTEISPRLELSHYYDGPPQLNLKGLIRVYIYEPPFPAARAWFSRCCELRSTHLSSLQGLRACLERFDRTSEFVQVELAGLNARIAELSRPPAKKPW